MPDTILVEIAQRTVQNKTLHAALVSLPYVRKAIAFQCGYVAHVVTQIKHQMLNGSRAALNPSKVPTPSQVNIAIIGCGAVGTEIARTLLALNLGHPSILTLVTRHKGGPQPVGFHDCIYTQELSKEHLSRVDLLIISVLPGQLECVAKSLRGDLNPSTIVISVCAGIGQEKICAELQHSLCFTTSINSQEIGAASLVWAKEQSQQNAEAVRASHVEGRSTPPDDIDHGRKKRQLERLSEVSFPAAPSQFFDSMLNALTESLLLKGVAKKDFANFVFRTLLPGLSCKNADASVPRNLSGYAQLASIEVKSLLVAMKNQFHSLYCV